MVIGETAARQAGPQHPRLGTASLRRLLSFLTELFQPRRTRVAPGPQSVWSRIDWIYTSAPGWLLMQMGWEVRITSDPLCMQERRESDHAPLVASGRIRGRRAADARPIPPRVAKTPEFVSLLQKIVGASDMAA